jgi:hypothetical protein
LPPPVKVKSPIGDRFIKFSCPTALRVALGAKVKELDALIVMDVVPTELLLRPPIVKFPTTITVEVLTVPFSPTTVELPPPIASQLTVALVPATLEVQFVFVAFQVALVPAAQPKPAVAPLLSM